MVGVYIDNIMHVAYEAGKDGEIETVVNLIDSQITWKYKNDIIGVKEDGKPLKKRHYYGNIAIALDSEACSFYMDSKGKVYSNKQINIILDNLFDRVYNQTLKDKKSKKKAKNKAIAEVVKARSEYVKVATTYIWQMAFNDIVITGRTWQEWVDFLATLKIHLKLDAFKELIIYAHNLKYDFTFFQHYFKWNNEKSIVTDKVYYYVRTESIYYEDKEEDFTGFLFKDSLALAGTKLENLPEIMENATISKQVGNIDHSLIRNSKSVLTPQEWAYVVADVLLLSEYIQEKIKKYHNNISEIPMTSTGEIRRIFKYTLFYTDINRRTKKDDKYKQYTAFLDDMQIDAATYQQIKRAFQGGFTHANRIHVGKIFIDCVYSIDIKSAYPAILCSELFAITGYEKVTVKNKQDFNYYIKNKACLFYVTLYDVKPRIKKFKDEWGEEHEIDYDYIDSIISTYKLAEIGQDYPNCAPVYPACDAQLEEDKWYKNNGKLRYADRITLVVNEIDWKSICMFYTFDQDRVHVDNFRIAEKGYLPKSLVQYVLDLYVNKEYYSEIKENGNREKLFAKLNKRAVNSIFGMIATDTVRETFIFNEDNEIERKHLNATQEEQLKLQQDELDKKANFLCYQWSHTLTSYCRSYIFRAMEAASKLGYNYLYSDTDSIKFIANNNKELYKMINFVKDFNSEMDEKKRACLEYHHLTEPQYFDLLGHFCFENNSKPYKKFCTTQSKRYLLEGEEGLQITVSGLTKDSISYLSKKYGDKLFEAFSKNEIEVDREYSGRTVATFCHGHIEGDLEDYNGVIAHFEEESYVHIESAPFKMNECEDYAHLKISNEIEGWRGL